MCAEQVLQVGDKRGICYRVEAAVIQGKVTIRTAMQ